MKRSIQKISDRYGKKIGLDLSYLIRNSFWVTIRQGIAGMCSLILSIVFVRFASQKTFGEYQFVLSILSILSIFSLPGLNTAIVQSVARGHDGDYIQSVRRSFLWSLLGVPLLFVLGGYYFFYGSQSMGFALMLASIFFPFMYAPNTWDSFLQGKSRFDITTKFGSYQAIFNLLATLIVIYFSRNNLCIILGVYLFSYTVCNIYFFVKSLHYIENEKKDHDIFQYGGFLTRIIFLRLVAANIDQLLVGILLGPVNLAIYSVVSMVAVKLKDVLRNFSSLLVPKFSNMEQSFSAFFLMHKKKLFLVFFWQAILSVGFYFFIPSLNEIFFTDQYAYYAHLSQIFSITIFLSIPLPFLGYYIEAKKNKFALLVTNPVFFTLKILINIILIYRYGLIGAVWAFNVSTLLWFCFSIWGILFEEFRNKKILCSTFPQ